MINVRECPFCGCGLDPGERCDCGGKPVNDDNAPKARKRKRVYNANKSEIRQLLQLYAKGHTVEDIAELLNMYPDDVEYALVRRGLLLPREIKYLNKRTKQGGTNIA